MKNRFWTAAFAAGIAISGVACGDSTGSGGSGASTSDGGGGKGGEGTGANGGSTGDGGAGGAAGGGSTDGGGGAGTGGQGGSGQASSFSPSDLAGLALWLDAAEGVSVDGNDSLVAWGDQSGHGNNGTPSQCEAPTLEAGSLNGHDVFVFDGSTACVQAPDTASLQWGTGGFALFFVARYANAPSVLDDGIASLWSKRNGGAQGVSFIGNTIALSRLTVSTNGAGNQAQTTTDGYNDDAFHRFAAARRADTLEVYVDGVLRASHAVAADDISIAGTVVSIGGTPSGLHMDGAIAEVIAVEGNLSDQELTDVDDYLKNKYGL